MEKLIINLPPEVEPYHHDIRRFVDAMVYKLKVHAKKGRWEGLNALSQLQKLIEEVGELTDALQAGNTIEILTEAADVANFAMIISSITVERGNGAETGGGDIRSGKRDVGEIPRGWVRPPDAEGSSEDLLDRHTELTTGYNND